MPTLRVLACVEREVQVSQVEEVAGRSGTTHYVLRDEEGNEYTTFRPQIGHEAQRFEGERAVVTFHEEERRGFRNIYLDRIRPPWRPTAPRLPTSASVPTRQHGAQRLTRHRGSLGRANPGNLCLPTNCTSGCTRSRSWSPRISSDQRQLIRRVTGARKNASSPVDTVESEVSPTKAFQEILRLLSW